MSEIKSTVIVELIISSTSYEKYLGTQTKNETTNVP